MTNKKLVLTTAGSKEEARKIAYALVERKLAACINIIPGVDSIYRWQGKVEEAQEWMLLIKTTEAGVDLVGKMIEELHSYELPECVAVSIEGGSETYLRWLGENVTTGPP